MISAIILAAGKSVRMGQPKMLLPWGDTTVLGQVISTYQLAGIENLLVVTGSGREQVTAIASQFGVQSIYNENYADGGMLSSVQIGLESLLQHAEIEAAMIGLGDQPQTQIESVQLISETFLTQRAKLIVPSHQMRRGHPWLIQKTLWKELIEMDNSLSPRIFLNRHANDILYVIVDTPSIVADLDTPQDYQNYRP